MDMEGETRNDDKGVLREAVKLKQGSAHKNVKGE